MKTTSEISRKNQFALLLFIFVALTAIHFSNLEIFHRSFIRYDDHVFVEPLGQISLADYFTKYFWQAEKNSFPLRDMTFLADFSVSKVLGFKTFWLTNFILYFGLLFIFWQIFGHFVSNLTVRALAMLWFALHPIHVEMVQWNTMRKHVLVALLLAWATNYIIKIKIQGHALTTKRWLAIFSAYIAALLCWPSAVLFIFWPLYIERHEPNKKRLIIAAALAALISGSYLMYTMSRGSDYDMTSAVSQSDKQSANQSDKHSVARQPINFLMQSIGRGAFDLILPYRLVPYSKLDSSINWIGWLVAVFVGLFLALNFKKNAALAMPKNSSENSAAVTANKYRQYKVKGEGSAAAINFEKDKFRALFLLMGLLFAPQMMVFLNYYEFVWADRYLFSTLPYMAIIMAISLQRLSQRTLVVGAVFVVAAFVIIDFDLRSFWQNAFKLFSHCVESENNPKCIMMAVESSFDAAGCEAMQPVFKAARTHISSIDQSDFVFRYEMPLYEGICVTRSSAAIDEQRRQLKDLESLYGERNALVFPLALVEFEQKRVDLAYAYARETIFNPEFKFGVVTPRVADIFRGQAQMTCVLADMLLHNKECMGLARQLDERLSKVKADPDHINWAQGEVQRAYNKK